MLFLAFETCRGSSNAQGRYHPPCIFGPFFLIWSRQSSCPSPQRLSAVSSASWPITAELSLSLPCLSGYVMAVRSVKTGRKESKGPESEQDSWNIHAAAEALADYRSLCYRLKLREYIVFQELYISNTTCNHCTSHPTFTWCTNEVI